MKSQKGIGLLGLLIFVVVMMLLLGVTTYVVIQDNGIYEREVKPLLTTEDANKVVEK